MRGIYILLMNKQETSLIPSSIYKLPKPLQAKKVGKDAIRFILNAMQLRGLGETFRVRSMMQLLSDLGFPESDQALETIRYVLQKRPKESQIEHLKQSLYSPTSVSGLQ